MPVSTLRPLVTFLYITTGKYGDGGCVSRSGDFIAQKEVFNGMMVRMKAVDAVLTAQLCTHEQNCGMVRSQPTRQTGIGHEFNGEST